MRNGSGTILTAGHAVLAQSAQAALFIDELSRIAPDFALPPDFATAIGYASLDIRSDQSISVLALRLTVTERNETILTTTPVADLAVPGMKDPLYFPHFADGGDYATSLFLLNTSDSAESGGI